MNGNYGGNGGGPVYGGGQAYGDRQPQPQRRGLGCGTLILIIIAFFVIMTILASIGESNGGASGDIGRSTVQREKLSSSAAKKTAYYTDEDGDWIHNPSVLEKGMKEFYDATGVWPYVYILPNGTTTSTSALKSAAEDAYGKLFSDEAHFLLLFCDDGHGSYNCGYAVGTQAKTIMDSEAVEILADYLDRYYDNAATEEEMFAMTFSDTGKRIMTVTPSPAIPFAIALVVIAALIFVFQVIRKNQEKKIADMKHKEEVLKTPLEKFSDQETKDLEKKYTAGQTAGDAAQTVKQAAQQQAADNTVRTTVFSQEAAQHTGQEYSQMSANPSGQQGTAYQGRRDGPVYQTTAQQQAAKAEPELKKYSDIELEKLEQKYAEMMKNAGSSDNSQ